MEDKPGQELHLRKRPLASSECACPRGNHGELLEKKKKKKKNCYLLSISSWLFVTPCSVALSPLESRREERRTVASLAANQGARGLSMAVSDIADGCAEPNVQF
jgi:hypothetical protein